MLTFLFLVVVGAVVAIVVLFNRVSDLRGELRRLERQLHELAEWAEAVYAWVCTQAEATPVVARPEEVTPPEAAPVTPAAERGVPAAPEPVVSGPKEPVPALEPKIPTPRRPLVPRVEERLPPVRPTVAAAREHAVPRAEPRVPPAAAKAPAVPQPVVPSDEKRVPPARPETPSAREPLPPKPERRVPEPVPAAAAPAAPRPKPRADLEVVLGTAWMTRIGMIAVLAAAVFLLQLAWSRGWIGPPHVVALGVIAGIALMIGGELARLRDYDIQSQALTGGGAALLYLVLWAGQHRYQVLGASVTLPAMVAVTIAAAVQAVRHESETVATFAWMAGYAVPLLISGGSSVSSGQPGPLFGYLLLLSAAVFVVAQRFAWPVFTGLALVGAYCSGAYVFQVSGGELGWTLTYLMLITAGMLWVAATRQGRAGERFGAVGAVAGYLATGIVMLGSSKGSPYVPYCYLLALSGVSLWLSHAVGWRSMRWLGAAGSFLGFVLMFGLLRSTGASDLGHWLLLYAAMSVAGSLASAAGKHPDAEPLAISAISAAYAAAALLAWASKPGAVSDGAMFAYLGTLAVAVLLLTGRFEWPTFSRLGFIAAFLATTLLYERMPVLPERPPGAALSGWPLIYVAMLGAAALMVAAQERDRVLGGLSVAGLFLALPLTGLMGRGAPELGVPVYLAVAAVATLAVIEWQKWHGFEWLTWGGTWVLYFVWRVLTQDLRPDLASLGFASVYVFLFLAATWVRHGMRGESAQTDDALLAGINAVAYAAFAYYDLGDPYSRGLLALGLCAVYLAVGLDGVLRRPAESHFGPVLVGLAVAFLTSSVPLLFQGYSISALWALEATVLLGLGFCCSSSWLRVGGLVVLGFPLVRALAVDSHITPETYWVLINSRALSLLAVIAAMYISAYWYTRYRDRLGADESWVAATLATAATALLLWICSSEAWTYTGWQLKLGLAAQYAALSGVWIAFGTVLTGIGMVRDTAALRWAALALCAATVVKVFYADYPGLSQASYVPLLNVHAVPLLLITALLYAMAAWCAQREHADESERTPSPYPLPGGEGERTESTFLLVAGTGLLLWVASSESWMCLGWRTPAGLAGQHMALSVVWLIFGGGLLALGLVRNSVALRWTGLGLLGVTGAKALVVDPPLGPSTYHLLSNPKAFPLLVIAALLYAAGHWYGRHGQEVQDAEEATAKAMPVVGSVLLWWVLTSEAWRFVGWSLAAEGDPQQYALSAVWTGYAAVLVTIGLIFRNAAFRWTAIALFAVTVAKVFSFDLSGLDIVYRILALLGLGAALIAVGFGYQRLVREQAGETRD